jgi:hypothetical protein
MMRLRLQILMPVSARCSWNRRMSSAVALSRLSASRCSITSSARTLGRHASALIAPSSNIGGGPVGRPQRDRQPSHAARRPARIRTPRDCSESFAVPGRASRPRCVAAGRQSWRCSRPSIAKMPAPAGRGDARPRCKPWSPAAATTHIFATWHLGANRAAPETQAVDLAIPPYARRTGRD